MIADDGRLTLGWMIGGPAVILGIIITVVLLGVALTAWLWSDDPIESFLLSGFLGLVAMACTIGGIFSLYPIDTSYHRWYAVEGEVLEIDSRLVGSGDSSTSEKFVVRLAPDDREFGITDTRAALLQVGDTVSLSCKRIYVYAGAHGWDCNWVGSSSERR